MTYSIWTAFFKIPMLLLWKRIIDFDHLHKFKTKRTVQLWYHVIFSRKNKFTNMFQVVRMCIYLPKGTSVPLDTSSTSIKTGQPKKHNRHFNLCLMNVYIMCVTFFERRKKHFAQAEARTITRVFMLQLFYPK